ncbi:MAG: carbohydrate ABC transporter permease [Anaerolineales bacterium]|nr:carbohydrate ABC transporter permease [Anaerolineales bacterium]
MDAVLRKTKLKKGLNATFVTTVTAAVLAIFLMPFLYMILTSLKTQTQITILGAPFWPAAPAQYTYEGEDLGTYTYQMDLGGTMSDVIIDMNDYVGRDLDMYMVPIDGEIQNLALLKGYNSASVFLDPQDPAAGPFMWTGYYKGLERGWEISPTWQNYTDVWELINYPRMLWNTFFYAFTTTIGILVSCIVVAFGFSRFRFPGRDFLFIVLISTIFLPGAVTIIPTFTFFSQIGWVGTWLPLIVPSFFANAYDTFLLRQYFMTLPRELDEAAYMDGASPFRVLWSVIIPQSYPAIVAVTIFHVVWAWNDYFGPLIYLSTKMDSQPISVALARFNGIYGQQPQYIQAGALMTLLLPVILFFAAQRFFVQGIVITGVEK